VLYRKHISICLVYFLPENGAFVNWGALIALALGDIVAIDFVQRIISANSGDVAKKGCYIAGVITLIIGLAVSFIGLFSFHFDQIEGKKLLFKPKYMAIHTVPTENELVQGIY